MTSRPTSAETWRSRLTKRSGTNEATATDIFSLWDRVEASDGQHLELLIFLMRCTATAISTLRRHVTPEVFPVLIQALVRGTIGGAVEPGANVRFILPSPAINGQWQSVNDQRALEDFYRVLVRSLGGELARSTLISTKRRSNNDSSTMVPLLIR